MDQSFKNELINIGLDVDKSISNYFCGSEDIYEKILMSVTNEDLFKETYDSIEKNDAKGAFEATHKLKSELGYFCFDVVNDNVKAACEIFRANKLEGGKELLDEVKDKYYAFWNLIVSRKK